MAKPYKTLEQMMDSRLLYDKNPPPFGFFLIGIVAVLLIAIMIWSMYAPKTYVIKSVGTVVSEEKNYIMSSYTGEVKVAHIKEGDFVTQGDLLFEIDSPDFDLQEDQIVGMIDVNKERIQQHKRLEECIKIGVNQFDENDDKEKPYYYQYETYLSQVGQKELDISTYIKYEYTEEQIENAIRINAAAIAEVYNATLRAVAESVRSLESEIESYEVQLESIRNGQVQYRVYANTSGIVHMDTEIKKGMVVQAAVAIGSIVKENETYTVHAYVASNDMPLIHLGDKVDIAVFGLTQSIYGTIDGTVSYIASEATINSSNNSSTFLVKVDLASLYLVSNQGNKVNLSNGMAVEIRVQYHEVSYFNYVLEALGVLTR